METKADLTRTSTSRHSPFIGIAGAIVMALILFWVGAMALSLPKTPGNPVGLLFIVGGIFALIRAVWVLLTAPFTSRKANCPHCGRLIHFVTNLSTSGDVGRCSNCKHQLRYSNGNLVDLGGVPPIA